jgi:hypothetical protein
MCRKKSRDDGGVPFVPAFLFAVGFCRWYNGHDSRLEQNIPRNQLISHPKLPWWP